MLAMTTRTATRVMFIVVVRLRYWMPLGWMPLGGMLLGWVLRWWGRRMLR